MGDENKRKVQVVVFWAIPDKKSGGEKIRILMLKTNSNRGEFWQNVTGSVNKGETFEQAAGRELEEETGFQIDNDLMDLGYEFDYSKNGNTYNEKVFGYRVKRSDMSESSGGNKPDLKLSDEHTDSRWKSPENAQEELKYDSNKEAVSRLVAQLSN
jgi:8-oxo-dGTP pyrophosphatase MutT (NUDIX family)